MGEFLDYWKLSAGCGVPDVSLYSSGGTPIQDEVKRLTSVAFRTPGAAFDAAEAFLRGLDPHEHPPWVAGSLTCELIGCRCYSYIRPGSTSRGARLGCYQTKAQIDWRPVEGAEGEICRQEDTVSMGWPIEWRAFKRWTEPRQVIVEGVEYQRTESMEEPLTEEWNAEGKYGPLHASAHWFVVHERIEWDGKDRELQERDGSD